MLAVSSAALLAACAARAPAAPASSSAARGPVDDEEWRTSTWEERHDVMTWSVLPAMARTFQRFRGTAAPDLTCRSCHGEDAERALYRMPASLPPLDPAHMPDPNARDPREARMAKFMSDEVTPQMAAILGVPIFDPATGRGFSCFSCHPTAARSAR